jgi:hypothetical protein
LTWDRQSKSTRLKESLLPDPNEDPDEFWDDATNSHIDHDLEDEAVEDYDHHGNCAFLLSLLSSVYQCFVKHVLLWALANSVPIILMAVILLLLTCQ